MNAPSRFATFFFCISLLLASCGKLKTADDLASTSPSDSTPVTQIYTDTGAIIGSFLGYAQFNYLLIVQFTNGPTAFIDFSLGNGKGHVSGLDPFRQQTLFQCYYSSADCSGDCHINTDLHLKNSIVFDGTDYHSYKGSEVTSNLTTNYSYRPFGPDASGAQQAGSCTIVASGNVTVAKPSQEWSLPSDITLPINSVYFGY